MAVHSGVTTPEVSRAYDGRIVVTVTPDQAQALAAAIADSDAARRDPRLAELAHSLAAEAVAEPVGRAGASRLSRGAFLRGQWGTAARTRS